MEDLDHKFCLEDNWSGNIQRCKGSTGIYGSEPQYKI
jgi:hypothetical protein